MERTKTIKEYIDKRDRPLRRALAPRELTKEEREEEKYYSGARLRLGKNYAK